mmetsp:Transcript_28371/g.68196  ORF Transcript_28371/g.68196 Transcript_28371/m.68196 type:complete len:251 (-) Transcript_28371:1169-1921(-)
MAACLSLRSPPLTSSSFLGRRRGARSRTNLLQSIGALMSVRRGLSSSSSSSREKTRISLVRRSWRSSDCVRPCLALSRNMRAARTSSLPCWSSSMSKTWSISPSRVPGMAWASSSAGRERSREVRNSTAMTMYKATPLSSFSIITSISYSPSKPLSSSFSSGGAAVLSSSSSSPFFFFFFLPLFREGPLNLSLCRRLCSRSSCKRLNSAFAFSLMSPFWSASSVPTAVSCFVTRYVRNSVRWSGSKLAIS